VRVARDDYALLYLSPGRSGEPGAARRSRWLRPGI